jgi:hypothetical protein
MSYRNLTKGEVEMARRVFGNSIPYEKVKIYHEKWKSFQANNTAVTPNGNLYYPPSHPLYVEDFSGASQKKRHNFMHEMAHVWQKYCGNTATVVIGGIPSVLVIGYKYTLDTSKRLSDYGLEAQANILADYYSKQIGENYCSQSEGCPSIDDYEKVLKDFLVNPRDQRNLPKPSTDPLAGYR